MTFDEHPRRLLQASIYDQLGMVAEEQRQWEQAEKYFLEALRIFTEYNETKNKEIVLSSLARLWKDAKRTNLIKQVASIIGSTPEAIEEPFQKVQIDYVPISLLYTLRVARSGSTDRSRIKTEVHV